MVNIGERRPQRRPDPYRAYNFVLDIGNIERAGFRECSGLDAAQDPIEYREGDEKRLTVRKMPGLIKYSNISLKYGITDDYELFEKWKFPLMQGEVKRENVTIILRDNQGIDKIRWNLEYCWPTKWTGASFNATGNEVAIETLEIAYEWITVDRI